MSLEGKVASAEKEYQCDNGKRVAPDYDRMQLVWERRQKWLKLPFRLFFLLPFYAQYYGPDKIESRALIVFDRHDLSSDPVFVVGQKGFITAVVRVDGSALLSRVANYFGGVMVPESKTKDALRDLKGQLHFHLGRGSPISLFPYADVKSEVPEYGIVRAVMQWEMKTGIPVKYVAAAVSYSNVLPFFNVWRMPKMLKNWPWPFLTRATLYISNKTLSSDGLPANSAGSRVLLDQLREASASLPGHYGRRGILQAFYTCARQFFSG